MKIEVSNSEIVDRAAILEIKFVFLSEPAKSSVREEHLELVAMMRSFGIDADHVAYQELVQVNKKLWSAIDRQEELLWSGDENDLEFAKISAEVVRLNRSRYELKNAIDESTNSFRREFKRESANWA